MSSSKGSARQRKLTPMGRTFHEGVFVPQMKVPEHNVTAFAYYDTPPTTQEMAKYAEEKMWRFSRFSSVIQGNYFIPVKTPMDQSYHIKEKHFDDEAQLEGYMQQVMAEPLDPTKPRWRMELCKTKKGRSVVMLKIAHSISDGLGLLFAFLPLMSCEEGEVLSKIPLPGALLGNLGKKPKASGDGASKKLATDRKPGLLVRLFHGVRMFMQGMLVTLITKPDSELKISPPKADRVPFLHFSGRHVWTRMPAVPTSDIKAVREMHNCTFNDAIMAALGGAVRRYSLEKLDDPLVKSGAPLECKCTMMIGLPRPVDLQDPGVSLANNIVSPVFKLPVGEATPLARLKKATERCLQLKSAAYLMGIDITFKMINKGLPRWLSQKLASEVISNLTMNVTNLPLAEVPIKFLGQELKEIQFTFMNSIPQVSMLSYNGNLCWNMVSDPKFITEPALLGKFFKEEFAAMAKAKAD